jgi:hypothetical protein
MGIISDHEHMAARPSHASIDAATAATTDPFGAVAVEMPKFASAAVNIQLGASRATFDF